MVDSTKQVRYHEWILQQIRLDNEKVSSDTQLDPDKHQESLDGRYGVDSNWIKGGSLYDFDEG